MLALPLLALGIAVARWHIHMSVGGAVDAVERTMRYYLWGQGFMRNLFFDWG